MKLNDFLKLTEDEIQITKIRLNKNNGKENPIEVFKQDPNQLLTWNYYNNVSYKPNQISIGLVDMGHDRYLLFTVGKIISVDKGMAKNTGVAVKYETLEKFNSLFGRLIIKYHNKVEQVFRNANNLIDDLEVIEYLPSFYSGFDFPGYDKVYLTYGQLNAIINDTLNPSYRNALENQKAVYVQTDRMTGKLYVGSATSDSGMLLARWTSYANNGHGGNKELKELVESKGFDYIKQNFTYAIIENFNSNTSDDYVLKRESYWKNVLDTRNHGYNSN